MQVVINGTFHRSRLHLGLTTSWPVATPRRMNSIDQFSWTSYDARAVLPQGWAEAILEVARRGIHRIFVPNAFTSREEDRITPLPICEVDGDVVRQDLPWLYNCYRGIFTDLAKRSCKEEVFAARCDRYGMILNIMRGHGIRYVCHVDSNPCAGLLYVTDHPPGTGGELVVAQSRSARSTAEVDRHCSVIYPTSGHLLFFDGRFHPHYVRPLRESYATRVVVAMNFYTRSCPESARPQDLDSGVIVDPHDAARLDVDA